MGEKEEGMEERKREKIVEMKEIEKRGERKVRMERKTEKGRDI